MHHSQATYASVSRKKSPKKAFSLYIFAGKTTLLKILAGKHMVGGRNVVRVLDFSSFHDTQLVCSGDLSYLGGSWTKTIGSAVRLEPLC